MFRISSEKEPPMRISLILRTTLILLPLMLASLSAFDEWTVDESLFKNATLIDEVKCGKKSKHAYKQYPDPKTKKDAIVVQKIFGVPCKVMHPSGNGMRYMAWQIGKGKKLVAGKAYLLVIEYPEDLPRTMFIQNSAAETRVAFHTGPTLGDGLLVPYINPNVESLSLPLSGKMQKWQTVFVMQEKFPEIQFLRDMKDYPRNQTPQDGFWVTIAQLDKGSDPLSKGAAIASIKLYSLPDEAALFAPVRRPPAELPQRHIFFREEMSDGGIADQEGTPGRAYAKDLPWFDGKMRLMKILAYDTFAKDLLEFGHNQGWDSAKFGGNDWVNQSRTPNRWHEICVQAGKYGLNIFPYYEYTGSVGQKEISLGAQRRARPLGDNTNRHYTHLAWLEKWNADLTDPDTFEDFRKMLEITVKDELSNGKFLGVWMRPRPTQLPVSFADATLERFKKEANGGKAVTREMIRKDKALYDKYISWWNLKRRDFLLKIQNYLVSVGVENPQILYTTDSSEPGLSIHDWKKYVVAEDPALWNGIYGDIMPLDKAIAEQVHYNALITGPLTWGEWEWHHSSPPADPWNYTNQKNINLSYTINRKYTVANPDSLAKFRSKTGLATVRHYCLNEHAMEAEGDKNKLGYFVSDVELAGPYSMMAEALAFAEGDTRWLGSLVSSVFNKGFPLFVRDFNMNFLALPAIPSTRKDDLSSKKGIAVRVYDAGTHGTYLALVNTGYQAIQESLIKLPFNGGKVVLEATGTELPQNADSTVSVSLRPFQLLVLRQTR